MPIAPIATSSPGDDDEPEPHPAVPYVHGRHLVPIRVAPRRFPNHRIERLLAEEDSARARIQQIDQALVDLATERRTLLQRIRDAQDQLRPAIMNSRGRRRRSVSHEEPLPPIDGEPTWLSGRELRAICLAFLRRTRVATTLRQLHVLLHRAGYGIASSYPAKTLADALGHETESGRVTRTRRATYQIPLAGNDADGDGDGGPPAALPDW